MLLNDGSSEYLKLLGNRRFHFRRWAPTRFDRRLVLIHDLGEAAETWGPLAAQLRGTFELLALDLRGHGGAPWDADSHYTFDDYLDDLTLQLKHWAHPSVLVGYGLGAGLATSVASSTPGLVEALVLISGRAPTDGHEILSEFLCRAYRPGTGEALDGLGEFASPAWRAMYFGLTWASSGSGRIPKCDPSAVQIPASNEWDGRLSNVSAPTLVIRSESSTNRPSTANETNVRNSLAHVQYANVPGGPWPHITAPERLAEAVQGFLLQLGVEPVGN